MWFGKTQNKNEENILYVSVDGRSIAVGFYTGNICHYSERRIQVAGETTRPIEILFKDILYAFKHVNTRKIDKIEVILENPWVTEISQSIKDKRLKSFIVNEKTINELVKKDTENSKNQISGILLGQYIENIKLNGYNYKDYVGKITDEIEILVAKFYGDKDIIKLIEDGIKSFWNKTKINFRTGNELLFKIANLHEPKNDMYIHLGSGSTGLRIYSQGVVSKSINLPFGFQNIMQKLGEIWQTNSAETKHWITMLISNELNKEEETRVSENIKTSILPMIDLLNQAIQNGALLTLERPIKITGIDKTFNDLFIYMFKNKFFGEIFPHAESTNLLNLNNNNKDFKGDILLALYVDKIMQDYGKKSN